MLFGWIVKAKQNGSVMRRSGIIKYDFRVVARKCGGLIQGRLLLNSLHLFRCLASLFQLVTAPVVRSSLRIWNSGLFFAHTFSIAVHHLLEFHTHSPNLLFV